MRFCDYMMACIGLNLVVVGIFAAMAYRDSYEWDQFLGRLADALVKLSCTLTVQFGFGVFALAIKVFR